MNGWARYRTLLRLSPNKILLLLSCLVGLGTGIATWLFLRLIEWVQFWPATPGQAKLFSWTLGRTLLVAIPALGGLLAGWVVQTFDAHIKGTGTDEVLYAIRRKGGFLSARYTVLKTLASVFTVCSGGAAGPEAPMVTIGAGLGSWAGRFRKIPAEYLKTLVAAGAAAGFAAVFNAPIAGVLFAIEVLLKEFASQAFAMVIMATVTASVTTHLLLGERVFVQVPSTYAFYQAGELGFYFLLALVSAVFAKAFIWVYFRVEEEFERFGAVPQMLRTMIGGLLLGLLGLFLPQTLGNGHSVIPHLIEAEALHPWAWSLLVALLFGKMIACPLTVGSGGSGGIFIPYLMMGALLGGLVGRCVHAYFPWTAPSGAYMLVGMGAVFSGITFAPFTGIILLFELTKDYNIILPLMFTVGITVVAARAMDPQSLVTRKLLKKGIRLHEHPELRALEGYHVRDIMTRSVKTIPQEWSLGQVTEFIRSHRHTGYPVVDSTGKAVGLITFNEMHETFDAGEVPAKGVIARDIMRTSFPIVGPEDSLADVVERMQEYDADRIVVMDPTPAQTMLGIVTKGDILSIYRRLFQAAKA